MTKAGIGAGAAAALLLCWAEAAWIGATFPQALEPVGGAFDLFRATAPPAVVTGAALGCLLVVAAAMARQGVRRWLPPAARETRWLALAGSVLMMVAFGTLAGALLRGRQAKALLAAHPLLLAAFAAAIACACYGCVLLLLRAVRDGRSRAARWAAMAGCAAVAASCYVADRVVLVRLYEPVHLALRAGAFVSALLALLLAWKLAAPTPRRRRTARWSLAAAGTVSLLLLLVDTYGPARARRLAASNVMRVHGAIGEGLVALGDALAGSRTRAPSPRAATVVADRPQPSHSEVLAPGANILLVTVDALRADHLQAYGYHRDTSPNLSRLAADSVVFERAYTSAPHTSFAITSLLTGYPAMSLANRGMLDGTPTLAELARAHGYRTAAFYPPAVFFVDGERLKAFEDHAFGFEFTMADGLDENVSAEVQTDRVLSFLTERSPERFLAWVHYFAPHEPYVDHPDDGPSFGPRAVDRYDGEIRWVDRHIGRLIARVRARHPYTIVVVTADHGEEFGEHGGAYHGTTLFDEQVKVPLLVSIPGVDGARIRAPVSTTAVVPTVLGATGMRAGARFDGIDLTPWLAPGSSLSEASLPPVFAENIKMRMAASGSDKLICHTRTDRCALYELASDPVELVDTSPTRPDRVRTLREGMDAWVARQDGLRGRLDVWSELSDRTAAPSLRRAAARAMARTPEAARQPLLRAAWEREQDPAVGAWLAVALAEVGDRAARAAIPGLVDKVHDADDDLRAHAALARARFEPTTAIEDLAGALTRVSDVNLRCALMHALAQHGSRRGAATLLREYEPVRSRICCAEALATLHDPATLPFIVDRLAGEPYTLVQTALVRALGRIGDRRAVAALRALRASSAEADLVRAIDAVLADFDS